MRLATIALLTPGQRAVPVRHAGGTAAGHRRHHPVRARLHGYDRLTHGRIHPAFQWGGLFLVVSLPVRFAVGTTAAWGALAEWLTR
jgi:hypothetical protein